MITNYTEMFNLIDNYLKDKVCNVDNTILEAVEQRKNGKKFSFSEHLKGLVFSLLSNQRDWSEIHKNRQFIVDLFFNFDKEKIKATDYNYFIARLKSKKLGNRAINKQMVALYNNITVLEILESKYDSLDNFVTSLKPYDVAKILANNNNKYSLKQIGVALALEYLRNVGIDTVKPDVHIIRILKRFGLIKGNCVVEKETINVIEYLSQMTGYSKVKIDFLLWHFCSDGYGNICGDKPRCNECIIKDYCNNYTANHKKQKVIIVKKNKNKNNDNFNAQKEIKDIVNNNLIDNYKNLNIKNFNTHIKISANLSKKDLIFVSENLIKDYFKVSNCKIIKEDNGRNKTLFKIIDSKETYYIKIGSYRYNEQTSNNYAYFLKNNFDIKQVKYLFFVLYIENISHIFKIPSYVFSNPAPNSVFKNRDYIGRKSLPEYGILANQETLKELMRYEIK